MSSDEGGYDYDDVPKKRAKRKKKDPNAPKRPQSSFFLYSNAMRESVKENNPDASFGDVVSLFGMLVLPRLGQFLSLLAGMKLASVTVPKFDLFSLG